MRLDDSGLYYHNARYYDASIGRFISADTVVPDPADPQHLNRYTYCLNNPLKYTDPTGRAWWAAVYGFVETAFDLGMLRHRRAVHGAVA